MNRCSRGNCSRRYRATWKPSVSSVSTKTDANAIPRPWTWRTIYAVSCPGKRCARPAPAWERAWKWVRRRPVLAVTCLFVVVLLVLLLVAREMHLTAAIAQARAVAREADDQRNRTTALASLENGLHNVEGAVNARHWQDARLQLAALRAHLASVRERFPDDAELASLQGRLAPLEGQIEGRLTDEERYQHLRRYRNEVAFLATRLAGLDPATRLKRMRTLAAAALELFQGQSDEGDSTDGREPVFHSAAGT